METAPRHESAPPTVEPRRPKRDQRKVAALFLGLLVVFAVIYKVSDVPNIKVYTGPTAANSLPPPTVAPKTFTSPANNEALPAVSGPSVYAADYSGSRYYSETQINRTNAAHLHMAWEAKADNGHVGHSGGFSELGPGFEDSPIICHNRLIVVTPTQELIAENPVTGAIMWRFIPEGYQDVAGISRGAACWIGPANDPHPFRILYTFRRTLYEIDADTGQIIPSFGDNGSIDISNGIDRGHPEMIRSNSPPLVAGDIALVPFMIDDDLRADAPWGDVRAYDIHTGKIRWTFRTLVNRTATVGAANAWSMYSFDKARGLIYLPVGSASNDRYGGTRPGDDKYANCIVCLHVEDGTVAWSFQVVHHDLWDYDCPAEPLLFDFNKNGHSIPAVAVPTKMGRIFLFNRVTGEPLFPIREIPVPQSKIPGERTSPTQPMQDLPRPIVPQGLPGYPMFTPPSTSAVTQMPGNFGGCNWAGASWDKRDDLIITTANAIAFIHQLAKKSNNINSALTMDGTPYCVRTVVPVEASGVPTTKPPWGVMCAIDPKSGRITWKRPYGYMPQASKTPGYKSFGSAAVGGEIVTASGLIIGAGTADAELHIMDSKTGASLASYKLPFVAGSLPMIYTVNGKEYIVACCGGHGFLPGDLGDRVVAFAVD